VRDWLVKEYFRIVDRFWEIGKELAKLSKRLISSEFVWYRECGKCGSEFVIITAAEEIEYCPFCGSELPLYGGNHG